MPFLLEDLKMIREKKEEELQKEKCFLRMRSKVEAHAAPRRAYLEEYIEELTEMIDQLEE